jgi:hypothetical protein
VKFSTTSLMHSWMWTIGEFKYLFD